MGTIRTMCFFGFRRWATRRLFVAVLLSLLTAAGAAPAALAAAAWSDGITTFYVADPGDSDELRLTFDRLASVRAHDAGATIHAGERCTSLDAHTVECRGDGVWNGSDVEVGDGNDLVNLAGDIRDSDAPSTMTYYSGPGTIMIDGGAGNDVVTAFVGEDNRTPASETFAGWLVTWLEGGAGDDTLTGTPGRDILFGDQRNELALPGGSDFLGGGDGPDVLYGGLG